MGQGEEDVGDPTFPALKLLPLLHIPPLATSMEQQHSPDHPSTPPLQTPVSVPFRWEEQPGKPRSCCSTTSSKHFIPPLPDQPFKLELPPGNKITTTPSPSPTTVLDGPCNVGRPKFSSFRWFREGQDSYDSSVSSYSPDGSSFGVEEALFGSMRRGGGGGGLQGQKRRGFFGRIKNGKKVVDGGSCRFSPSSIPNGTTTCDSDKNVKRRSSGGGGGGSIGRNGSFSSVSNAAKPSHLLATIYQGLKHVMHWKSARKSGKEGQD